MAYPTSSTPHFGSDSGGTLKLLSYLALGIALMVSDHRGGLLAKVRQTATVAVEPVWWLASLPGRLIALTEAAVANQTRLYHDNVDLQQKLLLAQARIERLQALARENERLRALLGGTRGNVLAVQLTSLLDVDLDPVRQRVILDIGAQQGAHVGQVVIDSGGVMGQVISVTPTRAIALLVTDPDHALPAQVVRSGLRLIVYGTGRSDRLTVPNIPSNGDIRVGDQLITSGIGGRFPAGFPVGRVASVLPDPSHTSIAATLIPAARLDRSGDVLLVSNLPPPAEPVGPTTPDDLPLQRARIALGQRNGATTAAAAAIVKPAAGATAQPPPQQQPQPQPGQHR